MTTSNGIKITKASDHFIARIIGSVDERRSGVEIDDIIACLSSPDDVRPIIEAENGDSQKFVLAKKCVVTINPTTGMLIQTNPRSL
ncbi:MAG: hypothetical protein E7218_00445 [Anaerofustis stercorihominis]|nr:hypothetical protein [Anaerofustis stercorihominis]